MCPSIGHVTWPILTMYINKLATRRSKMEIVVVHVFIHPQREGVE